MANFQVLDAYGSVITIQSSTFGSAERQAVQAFIGGGTVSIVGTVTPSGNQSVSGTVGASLIGQIAPHSVMVLNPVSTLAVNPNPASVWVLNPNQSVSGTVNIGSVVSIGNIPSVAVISLPGVNVLNVGGSVVALNIGSIVAVQGGAWSQSVVSIIAPTSSVMSLATKASTTTMLAANTSRKGATINNNSSTSIMVKLGAMANSGDFSLLMQNTDYYEVPFNYSGRIDYFSSSTAGVIKVTEIT